MSEYGDHSSILMDTFEAVNRSAAPLIPVNDQNEKVAEDTKEVIASESDDDEIEHQQKGWAFYLAFLSICLASFLSALDLTTVSTALPTIVANLPVRIAHTHHHHHHHTRSILEITNTTAPLTLATLGNEANATVCQVLTERTSGEGGNFIWVGTAYALAGTAIMPWVGSLAQIWGRKNLFLGSIVLFASGSAVCGSAPSLDILILGRVIQGIGDGGIISLSEILIADLVPLAERGTWEGLLGAVWAIASALGPPIGGLLSSHDRWRWLFYLNIPLSLIAVVCIAFFLVNRAPEASFREKLGKMDWIGNITIIVSLCCLTLAMTWGGSKYLWQSAPVLVTIILGGLLFIAFFIYEFRFARYPTIPPTIFSSNTAKGAYLSTFLHGLVSMAIIYLLPTYFQACLHASPARSGIMILPLALTIAPFAIAGAVTIELTERYIAINYAGWALSIVGLSLLTLLGSHPHVWVWVLVQIPLGIGLGFLFVSPQFPILAATIPQLAAPALATYTFVSSLGQTLGIAVGDAVLQSTVPPLLASVCGENVSSSLGAVNGIKLLPEALRAKVVDGFAKGFREVWISLLPFAIMGLLTCLALRTIKLHTELDEDYYALADRNYPRTKASEKERLAVEEELKTPSTEVGENNA